MSEKSNSKSTKESKSTSKKEEDSKSNSKKEEITKKDEEVKLKTTSKTNEDAAQNEYLEDFFQMRRLADKASQNSDPTPIYLVAVGALFIFLLLAGAVWVITDNMKDSILNEKIEGLIDEEKVNKTISTVNGDMISFRLDGTKYTRQFKGSAKAEVTLIEFSEFQCPFCTRVQPTIEQILDEYDGQVNMVHMNFIVHPTAHLSSQAVECAGKQDKYMSMHDKIFETSKTDDAGLKELAEEIGLDMDDYNECISSAEMKSTVDAQTNLGRTYDVRGTPSFLIGKIKNGHFYGQLLVGAQPLENFKTVIDESLTG